MLKVVLLLCYILSVQTVEAKTNANSKVRNSLIDAIVLHSIGGPYCENGEVRYSGAPGDANRWRIFFERHKVLGIHYIVDRKGLVVSSIAENAVANHALGWNERSVGIELVNDGDGNDRVTRRQWLALHRLVGRLIKRYTAITVDRVFRHSDIDKRTFKCAGKEIKQKQDPGLSFDYERFVESLR